MINEFVLKNGLHITTHLVEHCNLNCKGCDMYAPVSQKEYANVLEFSRDIARLSTIFSDLVDRISLAGGEPLLHPQLLCFMYVARKYFPNSKIQIVTNGILLLKQNKTFWKLCHELNIIIAPTKYPIQVDYDAIESIAKTYGVTIAYWNPYQEHTYLLWMRLYDNVIFSYL